MKKEFNFSSASHNRSIHAVYWLPKHPPKGLIQIVHGMAEYVERYEAFAAFLVSNGWGVFGHDHLGHGKSVDKTNDFGYFDKHHGPEVLIEDTYHLTLIIRKQFPNTNLVILGHSMGSFIVRNYLKKYSDAVDGAIIMGTGSSRPDLSVGLSIAKQLNRLSPKKENPILDKLAFANYSKHFPESSTFNWLSKNQANVKKYETDPLTGFIFTNNGFYTLFQLIKQANVKNHQPNIRASFPILIISGEKDPVGDFGKGPRKVIQDLKQNESLTDLTLHLYQDLRHELLNEEENDLIMNDLLGWIEKHVQKK